MSNKKYPQVLAEVYNRPWAITPAKLQDISNFIDAKMAGGLQLSESELNHMAAGGKPPEHQPGQSITVLPLWGTLHYHANLMSRYSGGTSTVQFIRQFKEALNDSEVGTIVIHANGPGGTVFGCEEASDLIFENRGTKKIIAAVDAQAASATYWIASSASEMYVTPSGEVGSIGVLYIHREISKAEEMAGQKTTLFSIPSGKVDGNPYEPVSESFSDKIMEENQVYYSKFIAAVARNRGVSETTVQQTFGQGGMVLAEKAAALGMVDGVKTFDQVIGDIRQGASVKTGRSRRSRQRAIQLAKAQSE